MNWLMWARARERELSVDEWMNERNGRNEWVNEWMVYTFDLNEWFKSTERIHKLKTEAGLRVISLPLTNYDELYCSVQMVTQVTLQIECERHTQTLTHLKKKCNCFVKFATVSEWKVVVNVCVRLHLLLRLSEASDKKVRMEIKIWLMTSVMDVNTNVQMTLSEKREGEREDKVEHTERTGDFELCRC